MTSIITTLLLVFAFNHVAESAPKPFGVAERNQLIMNAIQKLLQEEQKQETAELAIASEEKEKAMIEEVLAKLSKDRVDTQSNDIRKRPIYVVAHMVNGLSQINDYWVNYANAIESDLFFNSDGSPQIFFHGFPCDCGRACSKEDDVVPHFAAIREKAMNEKLTFFWMDLKLSGQGIDDFKSSGAIFAYVMTQSGSLFPPGVNVPLYVLLGAEAIEQKDFFTGFREYLIMNRPELIDNFGYDFSGTDSSIDEILDAFQEIGIEKNIWIGDGAANCLFYKGPERLKKILMKRDQSTSDTLPFKVYSWTLDRESTMAEHLKLGVDAIITNKPEKLRDLIEEDFHDTLTLANPQVNPWEQIRSSEVATPFIQSCDKYWLFGSYCWKETNVDDNSWCWTDKKCSQPSDCFGDLDCSKLDLKMKSLRKN